MGNTDDAPWNRVRFGGKESDVETQASGQEPLNYFGARYYQSLTGRFTTIDPLGASARLRNPQTFNRYTYALNNPLRFIDPDGLEVPEACSNDPMCTITVKVNVIWDRALGSLTQGERDRIRREQFARAQEMYGTSNIQLKFTYTEGNLTFKGGTVWATGAQSDALNLVVTNGVCLARPGCSGVGMSFVSPARASIDTTAHELGHQFMGDPHWKSGDYILQRLINAAADIRVNTMLFSQGLGFRQSGFRTGLESAVFAAPLKALPTAPKP